MSGDPKKYGFVEDEEGKEDEGGALCDVAPTILDLLALEKPKGDNINHYACLVIDHFADMTGKSLLKRLEKE